jgi:hypothetical protein
LIYIYIYSFPYFNSLGKTIRSVIWRNTRRRILNMCKSMKNLQIAVLISDGAWDRFSASAEAVEGGEDC